LSDRSGGQRGALYLVPTLLGESSPLDVLPQSVLDRIRSLDAFVVENARSARHFLKTVGYPRALAETPMRELSEHTPAREVRSLLDPALEGRSLGLLSEAGCPAIADPGAALVALAHECGIRVIPLVGPSSVLLALMASGLDGQRFCFHGYLPVERPARDEAIRRLEAESRRTEQTQVFIETPYRNRRMFDALLEACHPATRLCVATCLTQPDEAVATRTIAQWRAAHPPALDKRPTVFLLLAGS